MKRLLLLLAGLLTACTGKYVRPTTSESVQATPQRLARGQYIVDHLSSCGACHTERKSGLAFDAERADGGYLAGGNVLSDESFALWVPNITGDAETGVGKWSDDELMRAIRDGVKPDGSFMFPVMPYPDYRFMSDEDVRAVVAYLRSVPKVRQTRKRVDNDIPFMAKVGIGMGMVQHDPAQGVPPPPAKDPVKRGEYLAHLGHCQSCHALGTTGPRDPDDDEYMAGSSKPFDTPGLGKVWAPNLTPDAETGLGRYSAEQIADALRSGKRLDGKPMAYPMSSFIPHLSGMTEADMQDLVAWLQSLKPVKHQVPPRELLPEGQKRYGG